MAEETTKPAKPKAFNEAEDHDIPHHKRRKRRTEVAELNMTSMIDVVFQLLIYFIVTVNFVIDEGVLITNLPQVSNTPQDTPPKTPVKIELKANYNEDVATVTVNGDLVTSYTQLQTLLKGMLESNGGYFQKDHPIRIHAGQFVRWQFVLNAYNAALQAEFTDVGFPPTQRDGG